MAHATAPGFRGELLACLTALFLPAAADAADLRPSAGVAPPLALPVLDGPAFSLAEAAAGPVLVHFFATWCPPCVPEMAALDRLAERRSGQPLTILAVDVAEPDARVRRFLEARPVLLPVLRDRNRSAARAWGVSSLPTSYLLDSDRAIAFVAEGDVDWSSASVNAVLGDLVGAEPAPLREKSNEPT